MKTIFLTKTRDKSDKTIKSHIFETHTINQANVQLSRNIFKEFEQEKSNKGNKEKEQINSLNKQTKLHVNHTSYQLMQRLLNEANCKEKNNIFSTQEEKEQLGELLTNRYKIENYKLKLQSQIKQGNSKHIKHLKLLMLLLEQVQKCQIEVKYEQQGLSIQFNNRSVDRLKQQIDLLQQQNQKRKKQMQEITKEYDRIVYQFNEVIQKLVHKQQKNKPYF